MNVDRIKYAFNIRENFRDIFYSDNNRLLFMDGLRCIGMFNVILGHSFVAFLISYKSDFNGFVQSIPWYTRWMLQGDKAVDLFFVISGFLIGQMLFREYNKTNKIDLKRFFLRRFWRLTPAYYLVILLFAIVAGPHVEKNYLWAFVFYVSNFLPVEHNYISFAWSLAIEEQFYTCFSLFVAFIFYKIKHQLLFLISLYISSFLVLGGLFFSHPELAVSMDYLISGATITSKYFWEIIYDNLHTRYGAIVLGIILAHLYVYHWQKIVHWMTKKRCIYLFIATLLLLVFILVLPVYSGPTTPKSLLYFYHVTHRNFFAMGIMFIMLLCLLNIGIGASVNRFLSSKIFYPVSQLTYSMYLFHLPMIGLSHNFLVHKGFITELSYQSILLLSATSFVPTFILASIVFVLIERPFMKLRN